MPSAPLADRDTLMAIPYGFALTPSAVPARVAIVRLGTGLLLPVFRLSNHSAFDLEPSR